MFIYYSGSRAYGTTTDDSDIDVTVVAKKLNGMIQSNIDKIDVFVYGYENFLKRQAMSNELAMYNLIHADDIIKLKENLIYLNDKYRDEYDHICGLNMMGVLLKYLKTFIDYYHQIICVDKTITKRNYHVYRVRGVLENVVNKNEFSTDIPKHYFDKAMNYKNNRKSKDQNIICDLETTLNEIKQIYKNLGGDKND